MTGSGDIAPATGRPRRRSGTLLAGTFAGLIALVVIGVLFITTEYRRGLIRTTLTASPRRGRVLAAKAVVLGGVTFVAGLVAAAIAVPLGEHLLHDTATPSPDHGAHRAAGRRRHRRAAGRLRGPRARRRHDPAAQRRSGHGGDRRLVLPYLLAVPRILPVGPSSGCCG